MSTIYWDDDMLAALGSDSQLFNKTVEAKVGRISHSPLPLLKPILLRRRQPVCR